MIVVEHGRAYDCDPSDLARYFQDLEDGPVSIADFGLYVGLVGADVTDMSPAQARVLLAMGEHNAPVAKALAEHGSVVVLEAGFAFVLREPGWRAFLQNKVANAVVSRVEYLQMDAAIDVSTVTAEQVEALCAASEVPERTVRAA